MISHNSRKTLNRFHRDSMICESNYINSQIIHKLKTLNATITPKTHTFRAHVPGYYVEWFYNADTATYGFISGATNAVVFRGNGNINLLCDEFERMFGYDI